jgi:hypothetical protein
VLVTADARHPRDFLGLPRASECPNGQRSGLWATVEQASEAHALSCRFQSQDSTYVSADTAFPSATGSITLNVGAGTTVGQISCLLHRHGLFAESRIKSGELKSGVRLPPERELASDCGMAYDTVRRATASLRERSLIITVHGRGTYVA